MILKMKNKKNIDLKTRFDAKNAEYINLNKTLTEKKNIEDLSKDLNAKEQKNVFLQSCLDNKNIQIQDLNKDIIEKRPKIHFYKTKLTK